MSSPPRRSALQQAMQPEFKAYARAWWKMPRRWPKAIKEQGLDVVSGGTDNHLMLVDLRPKQAKGKHAEKALDRAAITCNKNNIPFDTEKPALTSGLRLGSPAGTTRGFGPDEFRQIGRMDRRSGRRPAQERRGRRRPGRSAGGGEVATLCAKFPIYEVIATGPQGGGILNALSFLRA
jgi:glycine hydroxymethyltransferase